MKNNKERNPNKRRRVVDEIIYTQKGRMIEYPIMEKRFWLYLLVRSLAFAVDYIVIGVIQVTFILFIPIGGTNPWVATSAIAFMYSMIYNIACMLLTNGQTMGMKFAKIRSVHMSGFKSTSLGLFVRGNVGALYAIPLVGLALMLTNACTMPFTKGISLLDMITRSTVVTNTTYRQLKSVEDEYNLETRIQGG